MANFRKRGELQWQARIRRKGYPDQVKTFNTRAEAEEWARAIEHQIDRGAFVSRAEAEATTLYEALGRYEREITVHKSGKEAEKSVLRIWKGTELALRTMPAIRSTDIAKLRDEWLQTLKPATVLMRLQLLSHLFNIARKEWGMESLLAQALSSPDAELGALSRLDPVADRDDDIEIEVLDLVGLAVSGSCCKFCNN